MDFLIKRESFMKTGDICKSFDRSVSAYIVARTLKHSRYGHWKARKRPQSNQEIAKLHHQWVFARNDWKYEQWNNIGLSDECLAELGKVKKNQ